ncbi:P-loop NTPase fold protein [Vibrio sp. Makdt]|uniref:P-loop NTPase fold protein n=1 Tax=Vibrio sp. Makdt TaxID=2998828 RepID=UPI0022CD4833|nr:P-loop NTPase fold protein [Vibrio sp. Makdt]MDA0155719.1 P-loop NTPase fold protein [Vibrio sp. Makdt]
MPISVGVFGDWGAGKSTILELTKKSISEGRMTTFKSISMLGCIRVMTMQKPRYWRQLHRPWLSKRKTMPA